MSLLEGKSIVQAQERISNVSLLSSRDDSPGINLKCKFFLIQAYVPTLTRNWLVFVPAQVINFSIVPAHLRFLFVGGVSLFWSTWFFSSSFFLGPADLPNPYVSICTCLTDRTCWLCRHVLECCELEQAS